MGKSQTRTTLFSLNFFIEINISLTLFYDSKPFHASLLLISCITDKGRSLTFLDSLTAQLRYFPLSDQAIKMLLITSCRCCWACGTGKQQPSYGRQKNRVVIFLSCPFFQMRTRLSVHRVCRCRDRCAAGVHGRGRDLLGDGRSISDTRV